MALTFGTPTYKATITLSDYFGNVSTHTVEIVAASPSLAVANAQRLCDNLNPITGARIDKVVVRGHVPISGYTSPGFGDWREYQAWLYANLADGRSTTVKIPGPKPDLLLNDDKRFINPLNPALALFLARFTPPGNIAKLRGTTLSFTKTAIIRHVESTKGKKIKIG
jgi:hypothetical protein